MLVSILEIPGIYPTVIIHNRGYLGFARWHGGVSIRTIRTKRTDHVMYSQVVRPVRIV